MMINTQQLSYALEAILLSANKPLSLDQLHELFIDEIETPSKEQLEHALKMLEKDCSKRAIELKQVASGYRLQIRMEHAKWAHRLFEEKPPKYSRAMLETLALIAYRQPITRGEIEDVRGVSINSQIIKSLQERDWIRVVGYRDVPGRPEMLATTKTFLDYFNLQTLDQLPDLVQLQSMFEEANETTSKVVEPTSTLNKLTDDKPIPDDLQARANAALLAAGAEIELSENEESTSFRSLLAELDSMEDGLITEFTDMENEIELTTNLEDTSSS